MLRGHAFAGEYINVASGFGHSRSANAARVKTNPQVGAVGEAVPWLHRGRVVLAATAVIGVLSAAWVVAALLVESIPLAISAPKLAFGVAIASALAKVGGALMLFLLSARHASVRLRWVASGFLVLGVSSFKFGYLRLLLDDQPDLSISLHTSTMAWTVACGLIATGLLPTTPPRFSLRWALVALAVFSALSAAILAGAVSPPPLVGAETLAAAGEQGGLPLNGLTAWYWPIAGLPLGLTIAAAYGAIKHSRVPLGCLLALALTVLAGGQLHNLIWPSVDSSVLTTSSLLRLVFATIVAIGAIGELHRVATKRSVQLSAAEDDVRRLGELVTIKTEFSAEVAHEMVSPIFAIRNLSDRLAADELDSESRVQTLTAIQSETRALAALVQDLQASAVAERDEFSTRLRSIPVDGLLTDAAGFALALPGRHPIIYAPPPQVHVRADPERIAQVLRNLLVNAAKYSPSGTPIELRATLRANRLRIDVVDQGHGIHPDDLQRVFEKYERGGDERHREVPGRGIGLYLSRHILRAHGSNLSVESTHGIGSVFGFELEVVA